MRRRRRPGVAFPEPSGEWCKYLSSLILYSNPANGWWEQHGSLLNYEKSTGDQTTQQGERGRGLKEEFMEGIVSEDILEENE